MTNSELSETIAAIENNVNAIYRLDPLWKERGEWPREVEGSILHPPAAKAAVSKFVKSLGPVPPSYVQFLAQHDGWEHFWLDFTIMGAEGDHSRKVATKIREYEDWLVSRLKCNLGELTPECIAAWEAEDETNLYLPNHLAIATTFGGELLVFDRHTARDNGEMELVFWTLEYGAWEDRRFEGFDGMLEWARETSAEHLKKLQRKRPTKKAAMPSKKKKK